jgi:hypothetical protein
MSRLLRGDGVVGRPERLGEPRDGCDHQVAIDHHRIAVVDESEAPACEDARIPIDVIGKRVDLHLKIEAVVRKRVDLLFEFVDPILKIDDDVVVLDRQ